MKNLLTKTAFLLASALTLGSTLTPVANAQSGNPLVDSILNGTNPTVRGAYQDIRKYKPQADAYQAYLQRLYSACVKYGNSAACNQYQQRTQRQIRHQQNLQRQWDSYYNRRWVDSFGR